MCRRDQLRDSNAAQIEQSIWRWLDDIVIGENFCPFAWQPRHNNAIQLRVLDGKSQENTLDSVLFEMQWLLEHEQISTSILVLNSGYENFYEYLDLLDLVDALIETEGFSGVFQCASFHPNYIFADEDINDVSHYTNRSPFPLLHLLREKDITNALTSFTHPENIPTRNKKHARALGESFFKRYILNP
ncbi:MAG: DUF1415 domain-containing protein [Pseudomonadota bacterium]